MYTKLSEIHTFIREDLDSLYNDIAKRMDQDTPLDEVEYIINDRFKCWAMKTTNQICISEIVASGNEGLLHNQTREGLGDQQEVKR